MSIVSRLLIVIEFGLWEVIELELILLAVCVAVASAQGYGPKVGGYANDYSEPTPFKFAYDIKDDVNGQQSRQESGDGNGNVQGSYSYQDGYGIFRQVEYTADDYGFRANIKTNEPGTDNQNSADVNIYSDAAPAKYDAPKVGYSGAHKTVAVAPSYRASGYAAPSYGQGRRSGYGYAAPSYGHGNAGSYSAPGHGLGHARSYSAPAQGYGHARSYAAPSYGHGGARHGVPSYERGWFKRENIPSFEKDINGGLGDVLILLAVCVAVASAQGYGPKVGSYANDYSEPTPFKFSYDIKDDVNGQQSRQESGDGNGNVQGSYSYQDGYGIFRQVEYTADDYGFRANIKTNEPGTDNQNSADVNIYSDAAPAKYDAPKVGYSGAHKTVAVAPSYRASGYAAPSYGQGRRSGYGYAAPSYGHGNAGSYSAPGYGLGHARSYSAPAQGYGHARSYAAPSYGHGGARHGVPSYGYGRTTSYKTGTAY
ncbi:Cuticle protein 16.8 [Nymphon striatum]|nr:Cuticle protein 16.8 [Nymphon striatum]